MPNPTLQQSLASDARVTSAIRTTDSAAAKSMRYVIGKFAAVTIAMFFVIGCATPNRGATNGCCVYVTDGSEAVPSLIALEESLEIELLQQMPSRVRAGSICWYQTPEGGMSADTPGVTYLFQKTDNKWQLTGELLVFRHQRIK